MANNFMAGLENFLAKESTPVALGQVARALMGSDQNSVPALLGGVATQLGQSRIAANAAKRQAAERQALNRAIIQILSGQTPELTEEGIEGPTGITLKKSPGGKFKMTIDGDSKTPGGASGTYSSGMQTPTAGKGGGFNPRMLPF